MHGGKAVSQRGAQNGSYKDGCHTTEAIALRRSVSRLLKAMKGNEALT